jgi:hypothetical protein
MANDKAANDKAADAIGADIKATVLRGIRPGDLVFIECEQPLPVQRMEALRAAIREQLPDVRVFLLGHGLKVAAIAPQETTPAAVAVALEKMNATLTAMATVPKDMSTRGQ